MFVTVALPSTFVSLSVTVESLPETDLSSYSSAPTVSTVPTTGETSVTVYSPAPIPVPLRTTDSPALTVILGADCIWSDQCFVPSGFIKYPSGPLTTKLHSNPSSSG